MDPVAIVPAAPLAAVPSPVPRRVRVLVPVPMLIAPNDAAARVPAACRVMPLAPSTVARLSVPRPL